jgi:hypothetical protein
MVENMVDGIIELRWLERKKPIAVDDWVMPIVERTLQYRVFSTGWATGDVGGFTDWKDVRTEVEK